MSFYLCASKTQLLVITIMFGRMDLIYVEGESKYHNNEEMLPLITGV